MTGAARGAGSSLLWAQVGLGADRVTVGRAWPAGPPAADADRRDAGAGLRLRVEGRDGAGRLRAGEMTVRRAHPAPAPGGARAPGPGAGATARPGWEVTDVVLAPPAADRRLPGLEPLCRNDSGGELLVHRYGRRAVVRLPDRYAKVVRESHAARTAQAARSGAQLAGRAGLAAPAVLRQDAGLLEFSVVPGVSMCEHGRGASPRDWDSAWRRWAQRWVDLVEAGADAGHDLPRHTSAEEQAHVRAWAARARAFDLLPISRASLARKADRVAADLGAASGALAVSHRDLHDQQILVGPNGVGLLDFDTAALAEPALDLGNLAVHLQLRVAQGLWSPWHRDVAVGWVAAAARRLGVEDDRLAAYAAATRLRLACLYAFRPQWRALAGALLDERAWPVARGGPTWLMLDRTGVGP